MAGLEPYDRGSGAYNYYPSPFFDLARQYMPTNVKSMLQWCRFYFYTHPIVNQVVTKMTEYPITDFIIESDEKGLRDEYEKIFKSLNMRSFLIQLGMDYYTYGNGFASIYFPFVRSLTGTCGHKVNIKNAEYKVRGYQLYGKCKACGKESSFAMSDISSKETSRIKLVRWNPLNIQMEHNEISGETFHYLSISNRVRRGIEAGKPVYWESTPESFIKAIKEKKWLRFKDDKLYHFKRPSLADENMEWGKPLVLPVLREIFHLYTLRKAQEAIAIDRIIPLRFLFPEQRSSNIDPMYHSNLGEWRSKVEEEVRKWKADPLYVSIMPVPLGNSSVGGEGKALMVFQEMSAASNMIENGMGMPSGFMSGEITYSGGNVVLRMLENSIITYRDMIEDIAQWAADEVGDYLGLRRVKVKMKEFKMADDSTKKTMLQMLNQVGKISNDTFLNEIDIDAEQEMEKVLQEAFELRKKELEVQVDMASTIQGYVAQIEELEPDIRGHVLSRMSSDMPETYQLVAGRINNREARPSAAADGNGSQADNNGKESRVMPPEGEKAEI